MRHTASRLLVTGALAIVVFGVVERVAAADGGDTASVVPADAAAARRLESVHFIVIDFSGSMAGSRNAEAMQILEESAREWTHGADLVIAVPFSSNFRVIVAGSDDAVAHVESRLPVAPIRAVDGAEVLRMLRGLSPTGGTRLFDTVADVLPALLETGEAHLVFELISDGDDNMSRTSEDEIAAQLEQVFGRRADEHRKVDVYLRRYERASEGLADLIGRMAAERPEIRLHDQALDAPEGPSLEVSPPDLPLVTDDTEGDGARLATPTFGVYLGGVPGEQELSLEVLSAEGLADVSADAALLAPGHNDVRLRLSMAPGCERAFWTDTELLADIRFHAGPAWADARVAGEIPAGWRDWRGAILITLGLVAAAGAFLALASFVFARRRSAVREGHSL